MTAFAITDNLDWTVSNRPVASMNFQGEWVLDPRTMAVHRDDNDACLGYVSSGYETVQNSDLLGLIKPIVEEGILVIENMGYLNNGGRVFIQSKIAQDYRVVGEDYRAYVTLLNGHVGNACVAIGSSNVRVICQNTFSMAYSSIAEKYRHHEGVNDKVLETKVITEYVDNSMTVYAQNAEKLASTSCSKGQFHKFLETIYQKEVKELRGSLVDKLNDLFYNGVGTEGKTYYDAFNAITYYGSHESRKTEEGCFNYVNFGQGSRVAHRAMNAALAAV
jgi:hypothetical protein